MNNTSLTILLGDDGRPTGWYICPSSETQESLARWFLQDIGIVEAEFMKV